MGILQPKSRQHGKSNFEAYTLRNTMVSIRVLSSQICLVTCTRTSPAPWAVCQHCTGPLSVLPERQANEGGSSCSICISFSITWDSSHLWLFYRAFVIPLLGTICLDSWLLNSFVICVRESISTYWEAFQNPAPSSRVQTLPPSSRRWSTSEWDNELPLFSQSRQLGAGCSLKGKKRKEMTKISLTFRRS